MFLRSVGRQKEPCVFNILAASEYWALITQLINCALIAFALAGRPEAVDECNVRNLSFTSLWLVCEARDSGGLTQFFYLEVFEKGDQHKLLANTTAVDVPEFLVQNLPPGTKLQLHVYAANAKGRSASKYLWANTLSMPQKQTDVDARKWPHCGFCCVSCVKLASIPTCNLFQLFWSDLTSVFTPPPPSPPPPSLFLSSLTRVTCGLKNISRHMRVWL